MGCVALAWLVAVICAVVSKSKLDALGRFEPPSLEQAREEFGISRFPIGSEQAREVRRRSVVADLNLNLAEIAHGLDAPLATHAALRRIALAGASALALIALASAETTGLLGRALFAVLAASAGVVGAMLVTLFGRLARTRVAAIRQRWDQLSSRIEREL